MMIVFDKIIENDDIRQFAITFDLGKGIATYDKRTKEYHYKGDDTSKLWFVWYNTRKVITDDEQGLELPNHFVMGSG